MVRFGDLGGTGGGNAGEGIAGGAIRTGGRAPGVKFWGSVTFAVAVGAGPSATSA